MGIRKWKRKKYILPVCAGVLAAVLACCGYLGDYYPADMARIETFGAQDSQTAYRQEQNLLLWEPENAKTGFIFYPGGKVEHTAYIPLMQLLAQQDILCALVEMPLRLAVLDMDAAAGIPERYPEIESWYIGGHSLGGAMAASWLGDNGQDFEGLVLLGAYSTADLSGSDLSVLCVYGSEDGVMDREKYDRSRENLPADYEELVLAGGCHAYFGMYGPQEGDGIPTLRNEEQIASAAQAILVFMEP